MVSCLTRVSLTLTGCAGMPPFRGTAGPAWPLRQSWLKHWENKSTVVLHCWAHWGIKATKCTVTVQQIKSRIWLKVRALSPTPNSSWVLSNNWLTASTKQNLPYSHLQPIVISLLPSPTFPMQLQSNMRSIQLENGVYVSSVSGPSVSEDTRSNMFLSAWR